jgi:hypothetical protein
MEYSRKRVFLESSQVLGWDERACGEIGTKAEGL